ncbi:hypothetical protein ID866_11900 [Astraeus odoratus]|nr:hypothetical protein ID866_11900 [Astraeus odoratus]
MEGLVGQQQVLLLKLVEVAGGVPEGELEGVPGNEPEDGAGVEDGAGEEAQKKDKGKGKEKAL